ncbi:D-threonate kinase [Budvicia diplopodorum]|uniref:D-threonate kinase n=1 Tax=Budvicia diplopodorum TaxID=1119056 RepID=UPI00135A1D37|nr:four-carbon acid sugar kinase family protein [Budvicia diplopodorum]
MKIVVIADDFTGANDTGVQLAKKGARTEVMLNQVDKPSKRADVQVINTESRALNAQAAAKKVHDALSVFCSKTDPANNPLIYKKIDSTFRGNVGAEIDAAMNISSVQIALVAAAIPAAGRTTINGQCLVNNVPLLETEFANDPKTPIVSSHIKTLIGMQSQYPIHEINLETVRSGALLQSLNELGLKERCIIIADAEVENDLALIAHTLSEMAMPYLLVGAAGLANALPTASYLTPKKRLPVLVVAGSMSEVTRNQINVAVKENSLGIVDVDVESLLQADSQKTIKTLIEKALVVLHQNQHCVLRTCKDADARLMIDKLCTDYDLSRQQLGDKISAVLGQITLEVIGESQIGGLFLTGGDIAIAVARALNAEGYRIISEVAPCVPCGTFVNSEIDDLPVITKAGGFGAAGTLRDALYFIEEMYSEK